jgi:hypothetical protein
LYPLQSITERLIFQNSVTLDKWLGPWQCRYAEHHNVSCLRHESKTLVDI